MHEYAVTKSLIKIVIEEANRVNAQKVTHITLAIGQLSTVLDESVQMYFDIMTKDTIAEGSKLIFNRISAEFKCKTCGKIYNKPKTGYDCPSCGNYGMPTDIGKEFYIESIEID